MVNSIIPSSPSLAETRRCPSTKFAEQPDDSPINTGHFALLMVIYQHLRTHLTPDTWGTPETRSVYKLGDLLVLLYDQETTLVPIRTLVWNDN